MICKNQCLYSEGFKKIGNSVAKFSRFDSLGFFIVTYSFLYVCRNWYKCHILVFEVVLDAGQLSYKMVREMEA